MKLQETIKKLNFKFLWDNRLKIILALGLGGIVLISLSEFSLFGTDSEPEVSARPSDTMTSAQQYAQELEVKLQDFVASMQGAGKCKVMLTLETSAEYVFAQSEKWDSDYEKNEAGETVANKSSNEMTYILRELSGGEEEPIVTTELHPKVQGVIVACEGGDDAEVRERIISAMTTVLNISSTRVCVTKIS